MGRDKKQTKQIARGIAVDEETWVQSINIAKDLKLTLSAYIRSLLEADIKQRKERVRIGHSAEMVRLQIGDQGI